jgi:hypothetical protein
MLVRHNKPAATEPDEHARTGPGGTRSAQSHSAWGNSPQKSLNAMFLRHEVRRRWNIE